MNEGVRMPVGRQRVFVSCVVGAVALLAVGCSSDGGSSTPPATVATTTTTTQPEPLGVEADLTVTGDRAAVIKGTSGTCVIPKFGPPNYDLMGANYPDLGAQGSVHVVGPFIVASGDSVPASVRVIIGEIGFLSPENGEGITLSRNGKVVTIDAAMTGGPGVTEDVSLLPPDSSLSARVTGTIRCTK